MEPRKDEQGCIDIRVSDGRLMFLLRHSLCNAVVHTIALRRYSGGPDSVDSSGARERDGIVLAASFAVSDRLPVRVLLPNLLVSSAACERYDSE